MKRIFLVALCAFSLQAFAGAFHPPLEVNEKVLQAFNRTFNNATGVVWEEKAESYIVCFMQNDIRCRVYYDREGNITGSLRYYSPGILPLNLYNQLKKRHAKKTLFGVTEVMSGNETVYFVKMNDDTHWYTYKLTSYGDTEQTEKFRRRDN